MPQSENGGAAATALRVGVIGLNGAEVTHKDLVTMLITRGGGIALVHRASVGSRALGATRTSLQKKERE